MWIFRRLNGSWSQYMFRLIGTNNPNALQGSSIALDSDANTMAISAPHDNSNIGSLFIFQ